MIRGNIFLRVGVKRVSARPQEPLEAARSGRRLFPICKKKQQQQQLLHILPLCLRRPFATKTVSPLFIG